MAKSSGSGRGEDILLVVEHIKHQNQKGSLYVTSENLAFQLQGRETFDARYHFSDIKLQKISAEGKSKVQLQVILQNDQSYNFHFTSPGGQADQLKDRNSVKELLMHMLPRFKRKITKEMEEKNKLLTDNPRVSQLYIDLVTTGLMGAEEFWTLHSDKLASVSNATQELGISASFLADVVPKVDGANSMRYNLTPQIIQSIFKTYPQVRKKHAETVPDKHTEQEFWTMFFQSHYFHRDRVVDRNSDNIFAECAQAEQQEMSTAAKRGVSNPDGNLKNLKDMVVDDEEGFGMNSGYQADASDDAATSKVPKRSLNMTHSQLIQRFNHHSARILTTTESRHKVYLPSVTDEQMVHNGHVEDPVEEMAVLPQSVRQDSELDLLRNNAEGPKRPTLRLSKTEGYHQAPAKKKSSTDVKQNRKRREGLKAQLEGLSVKRKVVISSQVAVQTMHDLVGSKNRRQRNQDFQLPQALRQELSNTYASLSEILRHFWSCFPLKDQFLKEKVIRTKGTLEKFETDRLRPLAVKLSGEGQPPQILAALFEMVKAANTRYQNEPKLRI